MSKESSAKFKVLSNFGGKYSIWPINLKTPIGWEDTGKCGSKDECLKYVKELSGISVTSEDSIQGQSGSESTTEKPVEINEYKERPLVSIIMPTFNREKLLPMALKSILNQTYANWELIVVDDRSTDNTKALIESYSSKDKRVRYMLNERSKGPSGARNFGIGHANGKYIAFLDSDDEWLEHHLSSSIDILMNENVKVTLATYYKRIKGKLISNQDDELGELERATILLKPRVKGNLFFFDENFFEYNIMERFNLYHVNTMVLEKEVLDTIGTFNEALPVNEDYDLMFRISHGYNFCYINDYHFIYNYGDDNLYAYTSRADLLKDETLLDNEVLLKKLTFTINNRIIAYNYRKELLIKSSRIKDLDNYMEQIDDAIGRAYLSLGYINKRKHKIRAIKYLIKSLRVKYNKSTVTLLGRIILPIAFNRIYFDTREVWL